MERYSEYRPSSIQWLTPNVKMKECKSLLTDTCPEQWQIIRNKTFLSLTGDKVGEKSNDFFFFFFTTKGVIVRDMESGKGKFPKDFDTYQVVKKDELVFCLFDIDETPRTVGLVESEGMITGAYTAFKVNKTLALPEYVYDYYLCVDNIKALKPYYSGLRKTVRADKFLQLYIPLPPLSEQERIVDFLNNKTLQIDRYVAEREQEVQLLNELKESEIAKAVTQGLNPNVKMKDSGVPWIGMIPEHWEERALRSIANEWIRGNGITREQVTKNGTPCVRYGEIYTSYNYSFNQCLSFSLEEFIQSPKYFEQGDILFAMTGEKLEEIGKSIAYTGKEKCLLGGDIMGMTHSQNPVYLSYALSTPSAMWQKGKGKHKLKVLHTSIINLKNVRIPLPPLDEQRAIVAHIESKCDKINSLIADIEAEIAYFKEYKQRLIADCVTGQINVKNERN